MEQKLLSHITSNFPELLTGKLLIAVSGGVDSMVLVALCKQLNLDISIAHCNFNLRSVASDDATFVENYAQQNGVKFYLNSFETKAFAKQNKYSTQQAARELRYGWFDQLLNQFGYDYLLTAHHLDDNLETFLINLSRGSGLSGLTGIPQSVQKTRRPLLIFSKNEILEYATTHKIAWREDASNATDDYLRNRIRHQVTPELKAISDHFLGSFQQSISHLKSAEILLEDYIQKITKSLIKKESNPIHLNITQLKKLPNYEHLLFHLLKDYNFTAWDDIKDLVNAETGKFVLSSTHRLVKNRDEFCLYELNTSKGFKTIVFDSLTELLEAEQPYFSARVEVFKQPKSNKVAYLNLAQLKFPVTLRTVNNLDEFQPLGMQGKKKIIHFLRDQKIPTFEKLDQLIFEDQNHIFWLVGQRIDDRFKINNNTQNALKLKWLD